MAHDDMLDVKDMLDDWMSKYLGRPVVNWPKRDPYLNYVEQARISTEGLHNILNKEKENKTMTTSRERMNSLKKGMLVECYLDHKRGCIECFDYNHMLVGVRLEGDPSYASLCWVKPIFLSVITTPDGNAVQIANSPCPKPKRVVYDEEAGITVVLWEDGQKTIVRATEGEQMDVYDAFCAAYCKRIYGTNSALKRELNKILTVNHPKETEPERITMTESFQKLNDGIKKLKDALNGKSDI